eukprot:scaffold309225_cov36-Prasinocladus_malaysianus.AAC.1
MPYTSPAVYHLGLECRGSQHIHHIICCIQINKTGLRWYSCHELELDTAGSNWLGQAYNFCVMMFSNQYQMQRVPGSASKKADQADDANGVNGQDGPAWSNSARVTALKLFKRSLGI